MPGRSDRHFLAAAGLLHQRTLHAFNYVIDINGTYWGIQDDNSPRVDTGSIRATQIAPFGHKPGDQSRG